MNHEGLHDRQRRYWRKTRLLTAGLLLVWFVVSFVMTYWARELDFVFLGWPFSFWMAAQGGLLVYGLIIGGYAWAMNRLDRAHGVQEPDE
jgi:putative solute:sodium symporter small subunit